MIKLTDTHNYEGGYIGLSVPMPDNLPTSIIVKGRQLKVKDEFHITLINAGAIAGQIDETNKTRIEEEIVATFKDFIKRQPLVDYKLLSKFRFVQRDVRKTVIALTEVPGLDRFFESLRLRYDCDIPDQPTHVTMYTLPASGGIGLLSEEELNRDSELVDIPELKLT